MAPLVSICLPVWNGETFVEAAIKSALAQTLNDFELIVVDDCSTDESTNIVTRFADADKRIRLYRNDSRVGLFNNYNKCLSLAKGDYIKPFAQDDLLHPASLERLSRLIEQHPGIVLATCARKCIDEQDRQLRPQDVGCRNVAELFPTAEPINRRQILRRSVFPVFNFIGEPAAVLFKRQFSDNGFDTRFHHLGDLEYWLRLLLSGTLICTDEELCCIRHHANRQTVRNIADLSIALDYMTFTKELGTVQGCPPIDLLESAVTEIGRYLNQLVLQGELPGLPGEDSRQEPFFELAFHALRLLGASNSPSNLQYTLATNERHIRRLEKHLRRLLSDPGWRSTRLFREANRILSGRKTDHQVRLAEPTGPNDGSFITNLKRQHTYVFDLKKAAVGIKRSRSWKLRDMLISVFQPNTSIQTGHKQLKRDLAVLPYLQRRFRREPKVSRQPLSELIKERLYENISERVPKISVLICACNDRISKTLLSLNRQSLPIDDFEVIVIDPFDSRLIEPELELALATGDLNIRLQVLRSTYAGRSAAHNLALRIARSDLVVFLAGDFIPNARFLETHLNLHLSHPDKRTVGIGAGIFSSELRQLDFRRWLEDSGNLFGVSFTTPGNKIGSDFFYVGNSSVKKELIAEAGYFDEDFPDDAWDDYEMGRRLVQCGMRAVHLPEAHCLHQHPLTLRERCDIMKDAARNAVIFDCKNVGHHTWHNYFDSSVTEHKEKALKHLKSYRSSGIAADKYSYWNEIQTAVFVESYLKHVENLWPMRNQYQPYKAAHSSSVKLASPIAEHKRLPAAQPNKPAGVTSPQVSSASKPFTNRITIVGFGSVGQGVLPLLLKHLHLRPEQITIIAADYSGQDEAKALGIKMQVMPLTRQGYREILEPLLGEGDVLLNLAVAVSSVELIRLCQEKRALYLDTSMEPWPGGFTDPELSPAQRSIYAAREKALSLRSEFPNGTTALLNHGANPGLISHFMKQAILNAARDTGLFASKPNSRRSWAELAEQLGIKAVLIAERDTQTPRQSKRPGEFVNTWSVDGFYVEALQPAELGWGTHEQHFPTDARRHDFGCDSAIYLNRVSASTRVRSWTPMEGPYHGFLISHAESISIADFLTIREGEKVLYRPTCLYAYHPCDDAVLSLHELASKNWELQSNKRLIMDEITEGTDELGVLMMGIRNGVYWYGSRLNIRQVRNLAPCNNATSLQVAAGVLAGLIWILENPQAGIVEPEDLDHDFILDIARPYLGELVGVYSDWTPLHNRNNLFAEELSPCPWQFKNIRVV